MQVQSAVVLGASGLIGSFLVKKLLDSHHFGTITLLVRKPLNFTHPRLVIQVVDFSNITDMREKFPEADVLFCCIGTTMKQVKGNKALYQSIDYDIPVNAALIAKEKGVKRCCIVSSVGANEHLNNFYLQLKGKVEAALAAINLPGLTVVQPSLLIGNRNEQRLGEKIAQKIMPLFSVLMLGRFTKYKPINAEIVAKAMVFAAINSKAKLEIWQYEQIQKAAKEVI